MLKSALLTLCKSEHIKLKNTVHNVRDKDLFDSINEHIVDDWFFYSLVDVTETFRDGREEKHVIAESLQGEFTYFNCENQKTIEKLKDENNFKRIFILHKAIKGLSSDEFVRTVKSKTPKVSFFVVMLFIFGLNIPIYSNIFNTRLVYANSLISLLYITIFFIFFMLLESFVRHLIFMSSQKVVSQNSLALEEYMLSYLKCSKANGLSVKIKSITSSSSSLWENIPHFAGEIVMSFVFLSCLTFILGAYTTPLIAYYVLLGGLFGYVRFQAYKSVLANQVASTESLSKLISIEKEKSRVRFIGEFDFMSFYRKKLLIDEKNKNSVSLNNHVWGEVLRNNSFLSTVVVFICCYLSISTGEGSVASILAILLINNRLSSLFSSCFNRFFSIKINLHHLKLSASDIMDGAIIMPEDGIRVSHCDKVDMCNITLKVEGRDLISNYTGGFVTGDTVLISGPSGSGKTTLLKSITKGAYLADGEIKINGVNVVDISEEFFRERVSYYSSNASFLAGSLRDNFNAHGVFAVKDMIKIIKDSVPELKITNDNINIVNANDIPLSNGERQKLIISMIMFRPSSLIILDEPTSFLPSSDAIVFLQKKISEKSNSIVFIASHDPALKHLSTKSINFNAVGSAKKIIKVDLK